MNAKLKERIRRLMPNGIPRWIRCYDNGGKSFDRYTVIYTGHWKNRPPYSSYYVGMSENPFHPQGFGQHGEADGDIDRPKYSHLGKKISFNDLTENCQKLVISDYKEIWRLK